MTAIAFDIPAEIRSIVAGLERFLRAEVVARHEKHADRLWKLNRLVALHLFLGAFTYVVVYTIWLKGQRAAAGTDVEGVAAARQQRRQHVEHALGGIAALHRPAVPAHGALRPEAGARGPGGDLPRCRSAHSLIPLVPPSRSRYQAAAAGTMSRLSQENESPGRLSRMPAVTQARGSAP